MGILTCPEAKSFIHSFTSEVFTGMSAKPKPKRSDKQKWTLAFSSLFISYRKHSESLITIDKPIGEVRQSEMVINVMQAQR